VISRFERLLSGHDCESLHVLVRGACTVPTLVALVFNRAFVAAQVASVSIVPRSESLPIDPIGLDGPVPRDQLADLRSRPASRAIMVAVIYNPGVRILARTGRHDQPCRRRAATGVQSREKKWPTPR
jgi:hypothetical protein